MIFIANNAFPPKKHGDHTSGVSVKEYPLENSAHDLAAGHIIGRYPKTGRSKNTECTLTAIVVSGSGSIQIEDKTLRLGIHDAVKIEPNERYFWLGSPSLSVIMVCTPPWSQDQYKPTD